MLTSVAYRQLTPFRLIGAWLDPELEVVGRETLYPPGESKEEEQQRSISQMATWVAEHAMSSR